MLPNEALERDAVNSAAPLSLARWATKEFETNESALPAACAI